MKSPYLHSRKITEILPSNEAGKEEIIKKVGGYDYGRCPLENGARYNKITKALGGSGIWGVEFLLEKMEYISQSYPKARHWNGNTSRNTKLFRI